MTYPIGTTATLVRRHRLTSRLLAGQRIPVERVDNPFGDGERWARTDQDPANSGWFTDDYVFDNFDIVDVVTPQQEAGQVMAYPDGTKATLVRLANTAFGRQGQRIAVIRTDGEWVACPMPFRTDLYPQWGSFSDVWVRDNFGVTNVKFPDGHTVTEDQDAMVVRHAADLFATQTNLPDGEVRRAYEAGVCDMVEALLGLPDADPRYLRRMLRAMAVQS